MKKLLNTIIIEKDGWGYVSMNDGREIGLGDLNVDFEIIDRRAISKLYDFKRKKKALGRKKPHRADACGDR